VNECSLTGRGRKPSRQTRRSESVRNAINRGPGQTLSRKGSYAPRQPIKQAAEDIDLHLESPCILQKGNEHRSEGEKREKKERTMESKR